MIKRYNQVNIVRRSSVVEGISEADMRLMSELKKIGGGNSFVERISRFLGLFGGHDLIQFHFQGKAVDDKALARFVKTYGHHQLGIAGCGLSFEELDEFQVAFPSVKLE